MAKLLGITLGIAVAAFALWMPAKAQDVVIVCSGGAPCRPLHLPLIVAKPQPAPTRTPGPTLVPTPSPAPPQLGRPAATPMPTNQPRPGAH